MLHNTDKLSARLPAFADAALILSEENRLYFTEFPATDGALLVTPYGAVFYTDSRYTEAAAAKIGADYVHDSEKMYEELRAQFEEFNVNTVAIENDRITLADFEELKRKLPGIEFNPTAALARAIEEIRLVKSDAELDKIRAAQAIAEKAFDHMLGFIKPGMTEKQVQLELDFYMLSHGAQALSFETIAVAGQKGSMPHGVPGDNVIRPGDFLTMDYGAVVDGYHSDMTRTVAVGRPTEEQIKVYNVVLEAQLAGLAALKDGVTGFDADKASRDVIEQAGYGKFFGHGTGHGVGVEIHEAPRLSPKSKATLHTGNVVTVEPGIYLPGRFGVRIEDMAVITPEGHVGLTHCEKKLIVL